MGLVPGTRSLYYNVRRIIVRRLGSTVTIPTHPLVQWGLHGVRYRGTHLHPLPRQWVPKCTRTINLTSELHFPTLNLNGSANLYGSATLEFF